MAVIELRSSFCSDPHCDEPADAATGMCQTHQRKKQFDELRFGVIRKAEELVKDGGDRYEVARELIAKCPRELILEFAVRALADAIGTNGVDAGLARRAIARVVTGDADPVAARAQLADKGFYVGGFSGQPGRWVLWADASAEDHDARAEHLRSLAASHISQAKFHEDCARRIRAAGVRCLAELDEQEPTLETGAVELSAPVSSTDSPEPSTKLSSAVRRAAARASDSRQPVVQAEAVDGAAAGSKRGRR